MNKKTFFSTTSFIFSFLAVLHFIRLSFSWSFEFHGWVLPTWVSGIIILASIGLAWQSFIFSLEKEHNE